MEASDRKKLFKKHNDIISKVLLVIESDEDIKGIVSKFDKQLEMNVTEHAKGKEMRIKEACKKAKS